MPVQHLHSQSQPAPLWAPSHFPVWFVPPDEHSNYAKQQLQQENSQEKMNSLGYGHEN